MAQLTNCAVVNCSHAIPGLKYFVYPYVEIDGKLHEKLDKKFSFEEVKPSASGR